MKRKATLAVILFLIGFSIRAQKSIQLVSPSNEIKVSIVISDTLYYSIQVKNEFILKNSVASLITTARQLGIQSSFVKETRRHVSENIVNAVPFKRKNIPDTYNELTLSFRENFSVVFRAYDDGVAYRFQTTANDSLTIKNEFALFRFAQADSVYFPQVQKRDNADIFHTSFEEPYRKILLPSIAKNEMAFSPVLIDGSVKVIITESNLINYPGMFLSGSNKNELRGVFAGYPASEKVEGGEFKQWIVTSREPFIAKVPGQNKFPWRVIALAKKDGDLLTNDIVYRLATPAEDKDWSWIKPGISTEEWICGSNLRGVDFESGINSATYKHYIDFASRFGMQYVMLDAGWSDYNDLFKITPGLDLAEISSYAKEKNVGLILWTLSMTLDRQLDEALKMFNELGIKCIMTDFMDRDDQKMVRFYQRIAEATARNKIMVMFHGAFKNSGFERTYPHAITREAILGSEYNIWSEKASPEHDLLIPFIRMVSGPMDYEPGFMVNANKKTFRSLPDHVMSQGTRCHQLAMFVAYESPLQTYSGNPSDAWPEIGYTTYLASLPTTWDETVVLDAKLGDYLLVARRKENDWYLVSMTDWTPRELEANLSFLGKGQFRAFTVEDGINAGQNASDYKMGYQLVDPAMKIKIKMASGGGYVAKLIKLNDARP